MERQERQLTRLLFVGVTALMLMLAYVTYSNMEAYVTSVQQVSFLNSVMIELDDVMGTMHDEETGARGYLLARDSTFLIPYLEALRRRDAEVNDVARITSGTEWKQPLLPFFSAIERASFTAQLLVQAEDSTGDQRSVSLRRLQRAKVDMDEVRARYALITNELRSKRRTALEGWQSDRLASPIFIGAFSILAVAVSSLLFWRLSRALNRTERVRGDLRNMVMDLDQEVRVRASVQAMLQKILDTSPSGIMSFRSIRNAQGIIVDFEWLSTNKMACTLVKRDDLVGRDLMKEMPVHRSIGLFDAYVNVVETGKPYISEFDFEGTGFEGRFANHAVKLDDGFLVIFQDITEQRRLQQLRMDAERFHLIGQVTRTIAHEVRNPLTNIHLAMEEIQSEADPEKDELGPYFQIVSRNLQRIGDLVKQMLESTQARDLRLTSVPVDDLVEGAVRKVADRLALKSMEANVIPLEGAFVAVDPDLIILAMTNLMVNAIEAMEPGKGVLTISATEEGGTIRLEIRDNGKGMSEKVLARLFDPFFTDRPGGLGLGLTTAQSILNGHGVLLTVRSTLGTGTTFTLHFASPQS